MSEIRTNWTKGQPIPAQDVRAASNALAALVQSGQDATRQRGGFNGNDARYVVKITAVSITAELAEYEFEQVRWDGAEWIAATNPITHESIGKIVSQGRLDSVHAGVDDVVTIRPGSRTDADGRTQWEFVPSGNQYYYAKVTASSSSVADITLAEVDSAGSLLTGGRTPTDAQVPNERKGVPVDTFGMAFELPPVTAGGEIVTKFVPWDGLTTTPKDLILDGLTADVTTYDIEADSEPVQVNNGRVWFGTPIAAFFWRDTTHDASGMQTLISDESRFRLIADLDDASYEGAIAFVADGLDGGYLKHNQPQATTYTLTLESDDASVTFNGGASSATVTFDEGGHYNQGNAAISIEAVGGGGSADGQGFEVVTDGTTTVSETDGGTIEFSDTANSSTTLGVNFAVASNTPADPLTATVTATVDASGLTAGDVGAPGQVDALVRIADGAASSTITLSAENFSGRFIEFKYAGGGTDYTQGQWDDLTSGTEVSNFTNGLKVGAAETSDVILADDGGGWMIYIDVSDGYKLKFDTPSGAATAGEFLFFQIWVRYASRKTTPDFDIT